MGFGLLLGMALLAGPPAGQADGGAPARLDQSCVASCDGELASCQAGMSWRRDVNGGPTAYCDQSRTLCVSRCRVYEPAPASHRTQ